MADTLFIKAAAFCGYDKADVDKRLETLYSLIYNLKNEIRENKQIIKKYEEGYSQDKAYENALAVERAQLTQLQVKNENLSEKNKARKEELNIKEQENIKLREEIKTLKAEVEELRLKQLALKNNDTEDLGIIFIEAKKSRDLIVNNAKQEASSYKDEAQKFAEDLIAETNEKVEKLIKDAEKKAADIIATAEEKNQKLVETENSLKENILANMKNLDAEIKNIKSVLGEFNSKTASFIDDSEVLLSGVQDKLNSIDEEVVEENTDTENASDENTTDKDKNDTEIDVADKNEESRSTTYSAPKNESGINLEDLLKQANELNNV
ncbi:MAG: hypothetical protein IJB68_07650 [Ruminococcus sp.]|nr:hypothetical protein [Ruminococcus sp.]